LAALGAALDVAAGDEAAVAGADAVSRDGAATAEAACASEAAALAAAAAACSAATERRCAPPNHDPDRFEAGGRAPGAGGGTRIVGAEAEGTDRCEGPGR